MSLRLERKYILGDFLLEPDKRRLWDGARPVHLARRPFQVLLYLIEHRDRVVPRTELLEEFWEGKDVYEDTLRKSVSAIRKAFGEGGGGRPRYVETRWGEGYRYVGPLEEAANGAGAREPFGPAPSVAPPPAPREAEGAAEVSEAPTASRPRRGRLRVYAAVAAVAAVALAALVTGALVGPRLDAGPRAAGAGPVRSVIVLPLKNLSNEPESEYLSDGVTESLISVLSKMEGLKVISRGTSFAFKGRDVDPRELGRQLGVDAAVEGSVRRSPAGLRVEARLVSARDGRVLLPAIAFERPAGEFLSVEDEVARELATGLGLGEEGRRHLTRRGASNVGAYQAYLKGRYFSNMRTPEGFRKALASFEEAVALDPNFAPAHAGLANYYSVSIWFLPLPAREAFERARAESLKALELDPELPEAYVTLADVYAVADWDWAKGLEAARRAVELAPSSAEAHHTLAYHLVTLGRGDEAVAEIGRAVELDPLNVTMNVDRGEVLSYAGRYGEAAEALRHAVEMDARRPNAHWDLAQVYEQTGRDDDALREYLLNEELAGAKGEEVASLRAAYAAGGMRGFWRRKLELADAHPGGWESRPYPLACTLARAGDADGAFRWLERAYAERSPFLFNLRTDPALAGLRQDPRYTDLLRRVGLP